MHLTKWLLLTICVCSMTMMMGCEDSSSTSLVPKIDDQEYLDAEAAKAAIEEAPAENSV